MQDGDASDDVFANVVTYSSSAIGAPLAYAAVPPATVCSVAAMNTVPALQ
jgi:hypothetical protein